MSSPIDAIYFVLMETARFQQAFAEARFDVLDKNKMDGLWTLPSTHGRGDLVCGRDAGQQLYDTLIELVRSGPHHGRIDLGRLFVAYKTEIMKRFVSEKQALTDDNAALAFNTALAPSLERLGDFTHIIPCHLVMAKNPDQLKIGPVTFKRREVYWPAISTAMEAFYDRQASTRVTKLDSIATYYSSFDWLAEIHVDSCEEEPSHDLAQRMAWSALDCLQLLIGGGRLERMTVGGIAFDNDRRSHITLRNGEIATVRETVKGRDLTLGDETWQQIALPDVRHSLDLMGTAIEAAYYLPRAAPLAERFIDAVHWFGLAMRDTEPSSRLIMMLIAVERLLLPVKVKRDKGIASTIQYRSAPFIRWEKHNRRIDTMYSARGRLAHGQLSTRATDVVEACRDAKQLASAILMEAINFFGHAALRSMDVSPTMIEAAFSNYAKEYAEERKREAAHKDDAE